MDELEDIIRGICNGYIRSKGQWENAIEEEISGFDEKAYLESNYD